MGVEVAVGSVGFDHINRNPPVLIRTPKLTRFEPAQYWGGGPPGNSVVLNPFFLFFIFYFFLVGAAFFFFLPTKRVGLPLQFAPHVDRGSAKLSQTKAERSVAAGVRVVIVV